MSRLLESLKITASGIENLEYHNQRCNRSRLDLFGVKEKLNLADFIQLPHLKNTEIVKCRVIYQEEIIKIEYISYRKKHINTLKVVCGDKVNYKYKFENRNRLNELFHLKGACDDILIVKDGKVTDFSYGNIIFYDGNQWFTPRTPLLKGTMRASLLQTKKITEREISIDDLSRFKSFKLINALLGFDAPELPVGNIVR